MTREKVLKSVLWFFTGILATVTVARFLKGLGATTALTDATPWGLWIAFDVMSGVALAAGGFMVAATVYVFGRKDYAPFARPAILTAFLGYLAVTVGLLYDLGIPLHVWHPIIYQQYHSVLFEVGMCVMLYLTVLFLEFSPVILEHAWFQHPLFRQLHGYLKRFAIPLVIAGIVLSTLHQSSLGSLFLITPYRVYPLWYSPIMWILFLISAAGLGLAVVITESLFSSWYFRHKSNLRLLSQLAKAASLILLFYLAIRLLDLAVRDQLLWALSGSWQATVFILELSLVALAVLLFQSSRIRASRTGLAAGALLSIAGVIGYRFNVSIVAFSRPENMSYFPSWIEIVVTLGIIAGAVLVFIFFVEHFAVFPSESKSDAAALTPPPVSTAVNDPLTMRLLLPESVAAARRYSLAAMLGAALALSLLSEEVRSGALDQKEPVSPPLQLADSGEPSAGVSVVSSLLVDFREKQRYESDSQHVFVIDGNRNGRLVVFDHDAHAVRLGGDVSCVTCHHLNLPFRENTSCRECHRDMYSRTDIFRHSSHVQKSDGNQGCVRCHTDPRVTKTRETAVACKTCHEPRPGASRIIASKEEGMQGLAVGYSVAMHNLCTRCHQMMVDENPSEYDRSFAECAQCHEEQGSSYLLDLGPYRAEGSS